MIPRYSRPEMTQIWTDEAKYQLWLEIESLALEGMTQIGVAPVSALESVRQKGAFSVQRIDELEKEVKHDVIAFLTNVAEHVGDDARYLHYGMTSSDLLDTTFAVQLTRATDQILAGVDGLLAVLKEQAYRHKDTVCIGRSHGIHAEPITFGLKVASWYAELTRARARISAARHDIAVGSISGPVGTYAHLSPKVEAFVCERLNLRADAVSTQVIARDSHAALFLSFALLAASIERVAVEVRHLQRTEVREAEENFTKGQKGSSAMPHKRNPILSENLTGLSRIVRALAESSIENIPLWHERDISHSSSERMIAPDITVTLDFMVARVTSVVRDLKVYPDQMQKNLDLTRGLIFSATLLVALAAKGMAREEAYALIQRHALEIWDNVGGLVTTTGSPTGLLERMKDEPQVSALLSDLELEEIFSLKRHVANVNFIFERVFGVGDK